MLTATKAWALSHLLANGMLADVLLFGAFLAWAVIDRISAGKRPQTLIRGAPLSIRNDVIAVVGGLLIYAFFISWAHVRLFGVAPMAIPADDPHRGRVRQPRRHLPGLAIHT